MPDTASFGMIRASSVQMEDTNPTSIADLSGLQIGVQLKARTANQGTIYIGGSDVSDLKGYPLEPGQSVLLPIPNTTSLRAVAENPGDILYYLAF